MSPLQLGFLASARVAPSGTASSMWPDDASLGGTGSGTHNLGTVIRCNYAGQITALRFYQNGAATGTITLYLYIDGTTTPVRSVTTTATGVNAWRSIALAEPYTVTANQFVMPSYDTGANGRYWALQLYLNTTRTSADGALTALASGAANMNGLSTNGRYADSKTAIPSSTYDGSCYFADVVLTH